MRHLRHFLATVFAVGAVLALSACDDDEDDNGGTGPDPDRVYTQIERLGNPLVSEVFFMKRDHGCHNTTVPSVDRGTAGCRTDQKIREFVASFGRSTTIQNTLATVLTPDMLEVYPNRAGNTAGWLSWALANGYGGRRLQDDVVDAGLMAIFGNLVDPSAPVLAGLTSDNVPPSVRNFSTTFPYLEAAQ